MMMAVLVASVCAIAYIYAGYWILVKTLARMANFDLRADPNFAPLVTVLLTCHNEAAVIASRLANIAGSKYPNDKVQILVALDGCTDDTEQRVRDWAATNRPVGVHVQMPGLGKTGTQNTAMAAVRGEIVVITDADTAFDCDFLREIVQPFADPRVGGATGQLHFTTGGVLSTGQDFYWRQEQQIRAAESRLGILAVGSGPCLAFRRELFRQMRPDVGDDCIIPLDIVAAGARFVCQDTAIAYETQEEEPAREFGTRVRMTLRNWVGTWSRPELLNPFKQPGVAFALWSHKILRWVSPLFLATGTIASLLLLVIGEATLPAMGFCCLYILGIFGSTGGRNRLGRLPGAATAFAFLLANAAFALGIWRALRGDRILHYCAGEASE